MTLKGEEASSSSATGVSAVAIVSGFMISQLARPSGKIMACKRVFDKYFRNIVTAISEKENKLTAAVTSPACTKGVVGKFTRTFQPEIFESDRSLWKIAEQANVKVLKSQIVH